MKNKGRYNIMVLHPFVGICLFILLYLLATFYYPGGSNVDNRISYFSWQHNYWCDLMAIKSKNGI